MNAELLLPPQATDAERSVLGGILIDGAAIDRVGSLRPEHFYAAEHRAIFRAMLDEADGSGVIDMTTIAERVKVPGILSRLASLAGNTPSAYHVSRYAEIVRERHTERALLGALSDIGETVYRQALPVREKLDFAQARIMAITEGSSRDPMLLGDAEDSYREELNRRAESGGGGLPTGFADLDRKLAGGLRPGNLFIVAGRPSMGKTAFAFQLAENAARAGNVALGFSLEMSTQDIQDRTVSGISRIPLQALRAGEQVHDQYVTDALAMIKRWPLYVDDSAALSVHEVRAKARAVKRRHGLALIVIDYLGLMKGEGENRNAEIQGISAGLKALAKELDVPVVALSQLNRGSENRVDRRPQLSDLRDSGAIEQDADIVAFVHREEHYKPNSYEWRGLGEILLRKNRQGETGDVRMTWLGKFTRFENFAGNWPSGKVAKVGFGNDE